MWEGMVGKEEVRDGAIKRRLQEIKTEKPTGVYDTRKDTRGKWNNWQRWHRTQSESLESLPLSLSESDE